MGSQNERFAKLAEALVSQTERCEPVAHPSAVPHHRIPACIPVPNHWAAYHGSGYGA